MAQGYLPLLRLWYSQCREFISGVAEKGCKGSDGHSSNSIVFTPIWICFIDWFWGFLTTLEKLWSIGKLSWMLRKWSLPIWKNHNEKHVEVLTKSKNILVCVRNSNRVTSDYMSQVLPLSQPASPSWNVHSDAMTHARFKLNLTEIKEPISWFTDIKESHLHYWRRCIVSPFHLVLTQPLESSYFYNNFSSVFATKFITKSVETTVK